jgi:hypothetical protein
MRALKVFGVLTIIWLALNLTALIINLLFSNLITGGLTFLGLFITAYKYLTKE